MITESRRCKFSIQIQYNANFFKIFSIFFILHILLCRKFIENVCKFKKKAPNKNERGLALG